MFAPVVQIKTFESPTCCIAGVMGRYIVYPIQVANTIYVAIKPYQTQEHKLIFKLPLRYICRFKALPYTRT